MKKIFIICSVVLSLVLAGCSNKEVEQKQQITITSGKVNDAITIGKELKTFVIKDQFGVEHTLTNKTKKVIFVFSKPTGHLMRTYMDKQPIDYLDTRDILFVADISGMPSIIAKMFAIPDMKKSKYPILLTTNKETSQIFKVASQKDAIMIITLDNKIVKKVQFVTTKEDIKKAID